MGRFLPYKWVKASDGASNHLGYRAIFFFIDKYRAANIDIEDAVSVNDVNKYSPVNVKVDDAVKMNNFDINKYSPVNLNDAVNIDHLHPSYPNFSGFSLFLEADCTSSEGNLLQRG